MQIYPTGWRWHQERIQVRIGRTGLDNEGKGRFQRFFESRSLRIQPELGFSQSIRVNSSFGVLLGSSKTGKKNAKSRVFRMKSF
jgi:hypothetical protein